MAEDTWLRVGMETRQVFCGLLIKRDFIHALLNQAGELALMAKVFEDREPGRTVMRMHVRRTQLLRDGMSLSDVTAQFYRAYNIDAWAWPMSR